MKTYTEVKINANFETVWQIFTNFEAQGEIKKGQQLTVFIQPSESGEMKLKPTILEAEAN